MYAVRLRRAWGNRTAIFQPMDQQIMHSTDSGLSTAALALPAGKNDQSFAAAGVGAVRPRKTTEYEGSGGKSEVRWYDEGEGLTIESQRDGGYVLAWSAAVPPETFLRAVGDLVTQAATTELSPRRNGYHAIPFSEAVTLVDADPDCVRFIAIDDAEDSFTWEAADRDPKPGEYPDVPGEVGIIFSHLNRAWIERLILTTATPHVREDIDGILASAQRLTLTPPPAST